MAKLRSRERARMIAIQQKRAKERKKEFRRELLKRVFVAKAQPRLETKIEPDLEDHESELILETREYRKYLDNILYRKFTI